MKSVAIYEYHKLVVAIPYTYMHMHTGNTMHAWIKLNCQLLADISMIN